jgi:[ribosomal protein S5]-alanine N-acetyltransferase
MTPKRFDTNCMKIRSLRMEDYEFVLHWGKDAAFCLANGWLLNRDPSELYKWWHHCVHHKADDFIRMGIEVNGRLAGYTDLANIKENSAELGIAIGESGLWGKGIGFRSAQCMMQYGFEDFGMTTFFAETHEANLRSNKMLLKLGFTEISRIGSEIYQDKESSLIQYMLTLYN